MLYILKQEPFDLQYDDYDAKVVRARSIKEARAIANEKVGDEGYIWEDENLVTCKPLTHKGDSGVVLASFNAG